MSHLNNSSIKTPIERPKSLCLKRLHICISKDRNNHYTQTTECNVNSFNKNIVSFWILIDKPMTVRSQGSTSHTRCSWPWWTSTPWSLSGDVSPLDVNNKICSFCLHICASDANCTEYFRGGPIYSLLVFPDNHVMLVQRMLGSSQLGTGGSSG